MRIRVLNPDHISTDTTWMARQRSGTCREGYDTLLSQVMQAAIGSVSAQSGKPHKLVMFLMF